MKRLKQLVESARCLREQLRQARALRATGLFDARYYHARYPDVSALGIDPAFHYVRWGAAEGRWANAEFDTAFYLTLHPEFDSRKTNPLLHYVRGGGRRRAESQSTVPVAGPSPLPSEIAALEAAVRRSRWGWPRTDGPVEVSIVIPVYGQLAHTLACLRSLADHGSRQPFEVVVYDDASTDRTPEILTTLPGLVWGRVAANAGFGVSCNAGAALAQGEFLVFLNNDTTVELGWLDTLRETFDLRPRAGLVGSQLIYPNGRLQEAGGLVFRDGSAHNFGRGQDPDDPRFRHTRPADYVSAAALMIRSKLFESLGGFDPRYAPAYYEDTDLAFQVRNRGLEVLVNPHARVVHHEGVTARSDLHCGIKRHLVINAARFRQRWADALALLPPPPPGPLELAPARTRVLVVDCWIPRPDQDSGSVRMTALLELLLDADCHATLVAADLNYVPRYAHALERRGVEILHRPYLDSVREHLAARGASYDAVVLSRRQVMGALSAAVRAHCPKAILVYDTVDLHFVREHREEVLGDPSNWLAVAREAPELRLIGEADLTWVVSHWEAELLAKLAPGARVEVLSNVHEVTLQDVPFAVREGILFVGHFGHPPNVDGVLWFAREVRPLLGSDAPTLHVIGGSPPNAVRALASERIVVHGYVPEIKPLFALCRLSVAPLRYGAGVKGKIGQSLALGLPCVTTSIGAEGMFLEDGVSARVVDGAACFAATVRAVHGEAALWSRLRSGGARVIERHFSRAAAAQVLARLVERARR